MPASTIGAASFVSMTPQPMGAGQTVEVESRAGVTGVGLWLTGIRGKEQTVNTVAIATDYSAAVALAVAYRGLIGSGALAVTYGDIALGNFAVLDVQASAERIACGIYATTTYRGLVRATWRLIAV